MTRTRCVWSSAWLGVVLAAGIGAARSDAPVTTVLAIRHAEKAGPEPDAPLSARGRERAAVLAHVAGSTAPAAIFSSRYRRARETVQPLADALGQPIVEYPISDPGESMAALATRILTEFAGQTVVVSGHSNTVPLLVEALGAGPAPPIDDRENDDLFVVTVVGQAARSLRLKYGAPPSR